MKKLFMFLMVGFLAVAFVACGETTTEATTEAVTTEEVTTEAVTTEEVTTEEVTTVEVTTVEVTTDEPTTLANQAPVIGGVADVTLVVGATFDNVLGVTANDLEDGDITADIALTGTVDLSTAGDYTLTYTVTDSNGVEVTATRTITVLAITLTSPSGFYNYKFATTEVRHTFMAAAEKYLMNNMYAGVPLFANGGFVLYSPRLALPVDSYIPVMGYGTSFGSMTADDSSVLMDDGEFGVAGEYTYRTTISTNPGTFNQWKYDTSTDSDLMAVYMDALYTYHFNADKSGYDLVPSMAASNPTPVGSHVTDTGKEVAQTWRISIADDLEWFYHPDTDISGFATGHEVIDANDFVDTFKLALDLQWFRAVSGGGDFLNEATGVEGAQDYVDGNNDWADVGIKLIDDLTFEFTFINDMSEWNVRYFLGSFVMTPVNIELYNSLQVEDLNSYGTDEKTIAYHGPFYVDYYENDKILRYKENPVYHDPDEYFFTGYTFSVIEDSAVRFQEFLAGKLEGVSLPTEEYDTYKDHPGLKQVPGATTFRMMINGLGTEADQLAEFPDSTWIPEPILANDDFKMAMFFAIDRQKLAEEVLKTSTTNMYYFSDAYLVDPEMGVPYRDTDQGLTVGAGLSPSTHGYNPTAATALYNLALDALVTAGDYVDGTAASPTVIQIEFNYFSGSEAQVTMYEYVKTTFEELFVSTEHYINVELLGFAKDFPDIYYDYMMVGEFDLSIGGISGSTLDAASFLDTYCSDNRGGFTLNWGIDTTKADIDILYNDNVGWHYESWSFDAITSALNGKVYVSLGVEAEVPAPVVDSVTATTATFHIEEFNNPEFVVNSYSVMIYDDPSGEYLNLATHQDIAIAAGAEFVTITDLVPYYYWYNADGDVEYKSGDYVIVLEYALAVDTTQTATVESSWFPMDSIFVESAMNGRMEEVTPDFLSVVLDAEATAGYTSAIASAKVIDIADFTEVTGAVVDFTTQSAISITGLTEEGYYLVEFTFADGNWDCVRFNTLDLLQDTNVIIDETQVMVYAEVQEEALIGVITITDAVLYIYDMEVVTADDPLTTDVDETVYVGWVEAAEWGIVVVDDPLTLDVDEEEMGWVYDTTVVFSSDFTFALVNGVEGADYKIIYTFSNALVTELEFSIPVPVVEEEVTE